MSLLRFFERGRLREQGKNVDDEKMAKENLLRISFVQDARRFQRNKTCDTGNTDELRRSCYSDTCKSQDLSHATGRHRKLTSARRMIMFAYPPNTIDERLDMQTLRLRADPPAGNVDSHNIVCSWCAQSPKGEATSGAILASGLYVCGTKGAKAGAMNPVLQKISTDNEKHEANCSSVRVHRWLFR